MLVYPEGDRGGFHGASSLVNLGEAENSSSICSYGREFLQIYRKNA
jgi:hypothetical protein